MSKPVANVDITIETVDDLIDRVNLLADIVTNEVITANATYANTGTPGSQRNAQLFGSFTANTIIAPTIRGGNVSTSGNMAISSNVLVNANSSVTAFTVTGNTTSSVVKVAGNTFTVNSASIVVAPGTTINANGSVGVSGSTLHSNGTSLYWAPISNTDISSALSSNTATMSIGSYDGTLYDLLYNKSALSLVRGGAAKTFARNWQEVLDMSSDLTEMRGYAAYSGTNGGEGQTIYKVWNRSDDDSIVGSLRWALTQANAGGGGKILFVTHGKFDLWVKSTLYVTGNNITIDAPGRNVRLLAYNDVEIIRVTGQNFIGRRLVFGRLPYYTHIDDQYMQFSAADGNLTAGQTAFTITFPFDETTTFRANINTFAKLVNGVDFTVTGGSGGTGTLTLTSPVVSTDVLKVYGKLYETDGLSIHPDTSNKVWIDQCSFLEHSDGALDCASSLLANTSPITNMTFSRNMFRRQDKTMAVGSTATSTSSPPAWANNALAQSPVLNITLDRNVFDGCGQRCPRAGPLSFVHKVNNVHILDVYHRDDGTSSAMYGSVATTGGRILSEGDYLMLGGPETANQAMYAETATWSLAGRLSPGALKSNGSVTEDSLTIVTGNVGSVPTPPYSITPEVIPASASDRLAYKLAKISNAGAEISPLSEMNYIFVPKASADSAGLYPDGYNVVQVLGGYRVRVNAEIPATGVDIITDLSADTLKLNRGATRPIVSDAIWYTGNSGTYTWTADVVVAVTPESGLTDNLQNINGGVNGAILVIRPASSSYTITLKTGGNIKVPYDVILSGSGQTAMLRYETATNAWMILSVPPYPQESTYTPTATLVSNATAATPGQFAYSRLPGSNRVRVVFDIAITTTAGAADTQVRVTLPFASTLTSSLLVGIAATSGATYNGVASISPSSNNALIRFVSIAANTYTYRGFFEYTIQ